MRSYRAWLVVLIIATSPAWAQNDDQAARQAAAHELLEAEQWDKITDAVAKDYAERFVENLAKTDPNLPKGRLTLARKLIEARLMETKADYLDQQEALIAQQISLQDLQSAIAFCKTPAGRNLSSAAVALVPLQSKMQDVWVSDAMARAIKDLTPPPKAVK